MKKNFVKIVSTALAAAIVLMAAALAVSAEQEQTFTGGEITPNITLFNTGTVLVNGTDYDLSYENNITVYIREARLLPSLQSRI